MVPPARRIMGELVLCAEGKRLYDEYCEIFEDESRSDHDVLEAWDLYYNHRLECDECRYR